MTAKTFQPHPFSSGSAIAQPNFDLAPMKKRVEALTYANAGGGPDYYPGPMIGAGSLGHAFSDNAGRSIREAVALIGKLTPDSYTRYLERYYLDGLSRFGEAWGYADIVTVLLGLSKTLKPVDYLEIGVRRGRSACSVGSCAPDCNMVLFDMWMPNYAGMENPGPDLVRSELARVGHRGSLTFIDGNSHETVPAYFANNRDAAFDIITVDGDHTDAGAAQDLSDVMPRLKIGGALVFDDICHPTHPGLAGVWRQLVEDNPRFTVYNFKEVGYGIGFAIRRY